MTVITVSRHYYSSGDEIVHRVCELLQYRYFDKLLIAEVAAETQSATGGPIDFSEDQYRMPRFLDRLLNRMPQQQVATAVGTGPARGNKDDDRVAVDAGTAIKLEQAAIKAAYERGHVVIAGRGGQAILHGMPDVLHVRIEAPLNWRIERLRTREEYDYIAAKQVIVEHDRAAADYVKRFYGLNWADPTLYHLVINCDLWPAAAAAQLIVAAVRLQQDAGGPSEA